MCGEDEPDEGSARAGRPLVLGNVGERPQGFRERLAHRLVAGLTRAPPSQAMVLLCDVRKLEVEAEGAENEGSFRCRQPSDGLADRRHLAPFSCLPCEQPHTLDRVEEG